MKLGSNNLLKSGPKEIRQHRIICLSAACKDRLKRAITAGKGSIVHNDLELTIDYQKKTVTVKGIGNNFIYELSVYDDRIVKGMFEK